MLSDFYVVDSRFRGNDNQTKYLHIALVILTSVRIMTFNQRFLMCRYNYAQFRNQVLGQTRGF